MRLIDAKQIGGRTGMTMTKDEVVKTAPVKVALSWLVVALPAAWGVYNTVLRAANLFRH